MVSKTTGCIAVAAAFSTPPGWKEPANPRRMHDDFERTADVVVTCKLSSAYRLAVAETIADRARIIFLDELDQPAARRAALSSATVLLAHNTVKELRADETSLIRDARLVQFLAAGVDFIPLDQLPPQVPLASNAGAQAESMAEHALAMALAAAKHLPMEQARMTRGEFNQAGATRMMAESTCGIFGLGGTGLALARLLKCLGARVHGINRRGESSVAVDWVGKPEALDAMLAASDMVFLTAPLTRETFGMIGGRELRLMKEDAIFVNLARGELVDEEALYLICATMAASLRASTRGGSSRCGMDVSK